MKLPVFNMPAISYVPTTYTPVNVPGSNIADGIPTGMQTFLATSANAQADQNAAVLQGIYNNTMMNANSNAQYTQGVNSEESAFLNTANNLGEYQANAISHQGKGK